MPDTYTNDELAEKIAWEGGLYEFVTSYGIDLADIERGEHERQAP